MSEASSEYVPTASTDETEVPLGQKLAAEVLGTFVLVLFGVGAARLSGGDYVATGLSFGLAVAVMAFAVGHLSGGHFNPAVSLGAAVTGRLSWRDMGLYAAAQLGGALTASFVLWVVLHGFSGYESTQDGMGQNFWGGPVGIAWWAAFILELVMTAVFVLTILAVTDLRSAHALMAPLVIGLTLAVIHFASMGATGTSVNPARSIGPGLFAGGEAIKDLWLFIVAPLLGAAVAGVLYPLVFGRDRVRVPGSGLKLSRPPRPAAPAAPDGTWQQPTGYPQQWGAPQGYQQPYPPAGAQSWEAQSWEAQQWEAQQFESQWRGQHVGEYPEDAGFWQAHQPPPPAPADQPWSPQAFPPAPSEPYWSQQLPEEWTPPPAPEDADGGHTQARPPEEG